MRKLGVLFFLLILVLSFLVVAQEDGVDKAYPCLNNEVANKSSESLSLQEAVFSTLALGSKSNLNSKIESERSNQNCWPKSACTIKETSQVLLAYDRINKKTSDIESYLFTKNQSATDLVWYLQIDIQNHISSQCTLSYDGRDYPITIGEDMKVSGGAGACLQPSSSGYWLQISRNCFEKKFQVSCEEDFITSLLYQKSGSQTIYVTSETHSAPSSGTTEEKVNSLCFGSSNTCDYEGTLWGALALQKTDHDILPYLPYLLSLAEDNKKLFPSSFLYLLTTGDDQYNEIIQSQKSSGFWEAPTTKYNKFYDTSLGLLALQGTSAVELETAKTYLLSVQTSKGCWNNNNLRDTAFLLYSGWSKGVSGEGGSGEPLPESCQSAGYFCGGQFDCTDGGGEVLRNFECPSYSQSCCSVPLVQETCLEKNGLVCPFGQECTGTTVSSVDGSCCLDSCRSGSSQLTECESFGGLCSVSCNSGEEKTTDSCNEPGLICCVEKPKSSSNVWIWMLILGILIVLAVLGILYRDKIKVWWFKFRNKGRSSPPPAGPRAPPRYSPPRQRFGPPISRTPLANRQTRRPMSKSDSEMEETLKKLKEMSK